MSALISGFLWNVFFLNVLMGVALYQAFAIAKRNPDWIVEWAERLRRFLAR